MDKLKDVTIVPGQADKEVIHSYFVIYFRQTDRFPAALPRVRQVAKEIGIVQSAAYNRLGKLMKRGWLHTGDGRTGLQFTRGGIDVAVELGYVTIEEVGDLILIKPGRNLIITPA